MADDELKDFLGKIEQKIGKDSYKKIVDALRKNNFTSRLSLKLLSPENLDVIFAESGLPLGSRKILEYHLDLLRDQSPLVKPSEKRRTNPTGYTSLNARSQHAAEQSDNEESTIRCLDKRRANIEQQLSQEEQSLKELEVNLESMNINVPILPTIGNSKVMCGNCHHKGHRNQINQPCNLQKCTSSTYCGVKEKHPEYFAEMNKLKSAIKKQKDVIRELQQQLAGIKNFTSQSEHHFIKTLTPRLIKVDPHYKVNKSKLLRDIRILRTFYSGKIPEETTNDAEQLRITLGKCKETLAKDVGDVAVNGIQGHEQSRVKNALNLNVNMNLSPIKPATTLNENNGPSHTSYFGDEARSTSNFSQTQDNNNLRERELCDFKKRERSSRGSSKRRQKLKREKQKLYSISSSSSESESYSSSSSDDQRSVRKFYKSRKKYLKMKEKLKHYRNHFNQFQTDTSTDRSLVQTYSHQPYIYPDSYLYGNCYQRPDLFPAVHGGSASTQASRSISNPLSYDPNQYLRPGVVQAPFPATATSYCSTLATETLSEANQCQNATGNLVGLALLSSAIESSNTEQ